MKLLARCNSFTTGHDSKMTLEQAYRAQHSPIRTQLFWVECTDIPLFVASQLVRSHVGVQMFQRSKRTDRGGEDFREVCSLDAEHLSFAFNHEDWDAVCKVEDSVREYPNRFDRYAPTDIAFIINAEALINMAHKRLCAKASSETRELMTLIAMSVADEDPALAEHLVPQCVYRGGICTEPKSCGWIESGIGRAMLADYREMLQNTQHNTSTKD